MSFGSGGSVSAPAADAFGIVDLIVWIAGRMTDVEQRAFKEEAERWIEAGQKLAIARREHDEAARLLAEREERVARREQQVAAAEVDTAARAEAAADKMAKAEQRLAEWSSLRAELRKVA
jgi:hypothetical protein